MQSFDDGFLVVDLMPLNSDILQRSTPSQDSFCGVLYCEETVATVWRSEIKINVVRHGSSWLVVRDTGQGTGFVWRRCDFRLPPRIRPFLIQSDKPLNQVSRKKTNVDIRLRE